MDHVLTTTEATHIIGGAFLLVALKANGHEAVSHLLFEAILNEWFEGSIENADLPRLQKLNEGFGGDAFRIACQKLRQRVDFPVDTDA